MSRDHDVSWPRKSSMSRDVSKSHDHDYRMRESLLSQFCWDYGRPESDRFHNQIHNRRIVDHFVFSIPILDRQSKKWRIPEGLWGKFYSSAAKL